jgi:tRNA (mo5U34)-methyltransferase
MPIRWFHSFDFGDGEQAHGMKSLDQLQREANLIFEDGVEGKSVLDIGAWDGYFSFEAERRGAARVLATDHFCWSGPGWGTKAGFDHAHKKLLSRVESRDIDVFALDPAELGVFDVVLFLGVLYHLKNPLGGLEQAYKMTRDLAVIETQTDELENPVPVMRFYLGRELANDPTNFWAPNLPCLENMLREVGFVRFKYSQTPNVTQPKGRGRSIVHAWKSP